MTLNSTAVIETHGDHSAGVIAQAIGGGGGRGSSTSGVVTLGGDGSAGGAGGDAEIKNEGGSVTTLGDYAEGLLAQSIGGSGGSAGGSTGLVAIGGTSGSGGAGGQVTLTNSGQVSTAGDYSSAIVAQNIGGGGGNGHSVSGIAAIGGSAGDGGNGGTVTVSSTGTVTTGGAHADGLFIQSIGGGGGSGTSAYSASANVSIAVGGSGGNGGDGDTVTVEAGGSVTTAGDNARGIVAQSIGGGGGHGGNDISASAGAEFDVAIGASGSGGNGGSGGAVSVGSSAAITTSGSQSTALFVQSVGGGGGTSGMSITSANSSGLAVGVSVGADGGAGGDGSSVTVTSTGTIATTGSQSSGVVGQSIGGGGGNAGTTINVNGVSEASLSSAIGGSGGSGGDAGAVSVTVSGDVSTIGNSASAIYAQSVGGGGGNGAITVSGSLTSSSDLGFAIGGSGGSGGKGSTVEVSSSGNLTTIGDHSSGIFAQSTSDGGGNGGLSVAGSGLSGGDVNIAVGGKGGSGGAAGDVTVSSTGTIVTGGTFASGIKALSTAGSGGSATGAINGTVSSMGEVGVTIGGNGGSGGDAGDVSVGVSGNIATLGDHSDAIFAASQGGGGGHGGFAVQGAFTGGDFSGTANVTVGGDGGQGGTGGDVTIVVDTDSLTAIGYESRGIFASSVGGAGGFGGSAYSGNITMSSSAGMNAGVTVGGAGGDGGIGGDVSVTSAVSISTEGHMSDGILAQSIGGNGGYGGNSTTIAMQVAELNSANFEVAVGGAGGTGNHGGKVSVTQSGSIETLGNSSTGIYAQSVGGGGGRGGNAASALIDLTTSTPANGTQVTMNANTVVGGSGGSGGNGNDVTVTNNGTIKVAGQTSYGIFAQSVGGGGGDGGSSSSYVFSVSGAGCTYKSPISAISAAIDCEGASQNKSTYTPTLQLSIGGSGGAGGDGGDVMVTNTESIETIGDASPAIFAQSVGGGGGVGGMGALGDSIIAPLGTAAEAVDYLADIVEEGYHNSSSYQSADIVIGGNGSGGGEGGTVTVLNSGALTTHGQSSDAIFAQSIGGGGGAGGTASGGFGTLIGVLVGGAGGAGGNGDSVSVTNSGQITTYGESAMGIFAQSVGGGGGRAGDIARSLDGQLGGVTLNIGKGVGIQQNGGDAGNGGDITIVLEEGGGITTTGDYAHGIFAHSVGGSGGSAHIEGLESTVSWSGSAGGDGSGGDVSITTHAPILVSGEVAHGIFAQSVSGTKTNDQGSVSGKITINVGADITSTGTNGRALLLQSDGYYELGAISVTVQEGATVSTTVLGSDTIGISNGTGNTLTNYGTISKPEYDTVNNYVIRTAYGGLSIDNQGTIEGSIYLDDETELGQAITNAFDNSGIFNMGYEVTLGKGATLTNDGTLSPGGTNTIITSVLSATLDQKTDGNYLVDLSMGSSPTDGTADQIVGEKIAVSLAGGVTVNPTGDNLLTSGESGSVYILQTADTTISSMTATVEDSATVDYSLAQVTNTDGITIDGTTYSSADAIRLSYTVDYSGGSEGAALGSNGLRFAGDLDNIVGIARDDFAAGSDERAAITDLVNLVLAAGDGAELRKIYDEHVVDEAGIGIVGAIQGSLNLHDLLQSCPTLDRYPTAGFLHQKDCAWSQVQGWSFTQDTTGSAPGYTESSYGLAAGVQREIGNDLFVEAAGNYELNYVDGSNFSQDGYRFTAGAALKKEIGAYTLSGTLSGGFYRSDYTRLYETASGEYAAHSDPSGQYLGGELRAYGVFPYQQFYAKPNVALGVLQTWQNGFTETGNGSFNHAVDGISQTSVVLRPSLELGQALQLYGRPATLFVRGGLTAFLTDPDIAITSQFSDFGGMLPVMATELSQDRYFAELQAGVEMDLDDRFSLTAKFQSAFSGNSQLLGGFARLRLNF